MIDFRDLIFLLAAIGFAIAALLTIVRIVLGPSILDRMVATDLLVTTLLLALGAEMVFNKHTDNVALMIGLAATSVLGTITVAQYVRRDATRNGKDGNKGD